MQEVSAEGSNFGTFKRESDCGHRLISTYLGREMMEEITVLCWCKLLDSSIYLSTTSTSTAVAAHSSFCKGQGTEVKEESSLLG